ncbi:Uncharacterised protein [Leminorella richardii]|uniref:Uncharacterized protein n=1 Tax=Leminorella richardii TaxID=158841 RepID=A0A2X4UY47_9GAMM|nr:DUF6506 family protein [Leminorella richardii]SQI40718.1 Uncharacterised protein [Leminorella richardii]
MSLKAAFIFISPEGNADIHHADVCTDSVSVTTCAVNSYQAACDLAIRLVNQGTVAIELCGGFGIEGVAAVKRAVEGKAVVGVVRFDHHPGLQHQSGDSLFS